MLVLLLLLMFVAFACAQESFWITAELLQVDWREGCLTTAGCSRPRFKDSSRSFVSHWTKGKPQNVTLSCQVVGIDPTYGFPRICDQTASVHVLQGRVIEDRDRQHQTIITSTLSEDDLERKLIEVRGKCFSATVSVQMHTERCPWCPDPSHVTLIEQRMPEESPSVSPASFFSQLRGDVRVLHFSVLVLAGIAVLASLGFACTLLMLLRQKRTHRQILVKPRAHPYSPTSLKASDDGTYRYDLPWEQTRPLTYWLSSSSPKSEATTTSPLNSASSFGVPSSLVAPYTFRSGCTIPQTHLYHHISPNSSVVTARNSGLESV